MPSQDFEAPTEHGPLRGWVTDSDGPHVLLLHGGPGLSFGYLDSVRDELGDAYRIAAFQQRGLSPSTTDGPFDVATARADVLAVLDALEWERTLLVGHSWGGHLALHVAVASAERLDGVLCVDPLGGVADGGEGEFEVELLRRTPEQNRQRAHELDQRAMAGEGTEDDVIESLALLWPAYFPVWNEAPSMPPIRSSATAYSGLYESLHALLPELEQALPLVPVEVGFVAGAGSPMPVDASSRATSARLPNSWLEVVDGAGHFPWLDRPGSVRSALDRLRG